MTDRKDMRRWNALNRNAQEISWSTFELMSIFQNADFTIGDNASELFVLMAECRQLIDRAKQVFDHEELSNRPGIRSIKQENDVK